MYEDCWIGKWKCNFANPEQWFDISIFSFFVSNPKIYISNKSQIIIPVTCDSKAKVNFDATNASRNV
jgi:hypothetical protein